MGPTAEELAQERHRKLKVEWDINEDGPEYVG